MSLSTPVKVTEIARIIEVASNYDIMALASLVSDKEPDAENYCRSPSDIDIVCMVSWYHASGTHPYCTTMFHAYKQPGHTYPPVFYSKHISVYNGIRVAIGEYMGVKGEWHLYKQPGCKTVKAPYER